MKKLIGLAMAAAVIWAAGCKSTTSQTAGGTVERLPAVEQLPKTATPPSGVQQASASGANGGDVVPAILTTPEFGESHCKL
jgi:hypothetical protein